MHTELAYFQNILESTNIPKAVRSEFL